MNKLEIFNLIVFIMLIFDNKISISFLNLLYYLILFNKILIFEL